MLEFVLDFVSDLILTGLGLSLEATCFFVLCLELLRLVLVLLATGDLTVPVSELLMGFILLAGVSRTDLLELD